METRTRMTTLARHLVAGDAHDRLPFRPDCPICVGTHGLAGIDPRTLTGTDAGVAASALRPVAGALSALLVAGALAPAPASAWRGTDTVNGDEGLSTPTTNEEDEGSTAEEGSDAEAPAVTTPDTPDEATGAAVEADTPTPPETPVPAPSPAPAPTPSPAPAPAAGLPRRPRAPRRRRRRPRTRFPHPHPPRTRAGARRRSERRAGPGPGPAARRQRAAAKAVPAHRAVDARKSATDAASASGRGRTRGRAAPDRGDARGRRAPAPPCPTGRRRRVHPGPRRGHRAHGGRFEPRDAPLDGDAAGRRPADTGWPRRGRRGRWHTVRAGETLWSLASGLLPPGATAGQIARQVAQLVALNADRIDSPDLIRVGQRLRLR